MHDIAGKSHWDDLWRRSTLPSVWNARRLGIANTVVRSLHEFIVYYLRDEQSKKTLRILEVGCGSSASLPYFAAEFGAIAVGIDYSEEGCRRAEAIAMKAGISVRVVCADFFNPPQGLLGSFDVVVSMGVVEHFSDTTGVVKALSRYLVPGGTMITLIPNLCGVIGSLQHWLDLSVYEKHLPIDRRDLRTSHEEAGLTIMHCDYFLGSNFGVCNVPREGKGRLEFLIKRICTAVLVRFSMMTWLLERIGFRFPLTRDHSPYIACAAMATQCKR